MYITNENLFYNNINNDKKLELSGTPSTGIWQTHSAGRM